MLFNRYRKTLLLQGAFFYACFYALSYEFVSEKGGVGQHVDVERQLVVFEFVDDVVAGVNSGAVAE